MKVDTCSRSRVFVFAQDLPGPRKIREEHPAPGGNIILGMCENSTRDWLRKTRRFLQDGGK